MYAKDRQLQPHGIRNEKFSAFNATIDLKKQGGMARGADRLKVLSAGDLWVRYEGDGSEEVIACAAGEEIDSAVWMIARGTQAILDSPDGAYPAANLGGKTLVLRLDEGDDLDCGADITVTFQNTDTTRALIIDRINAALAAAMPEPGGHPPFVFAGPGSTAVKIKLYSRGRGSGATVEVVSVHADVTTATGLVAGTTAGANFGGPADNVRAYW
jgi:hypothetical protein